jgi:pimeloyl-ACP methyl ester carboxylesterase
MSFRRKALLILFLSLITTAGVVGSYQSSGTTGASFQILRRRAAVKAEANAHPATTCGGTLNIGFRIRNFSGGSRGGVWYPTTAAESSYSYPGRFDSSVALDAPVATCGVRYPVVLFSHGFSGCSIQSLYLTEALARAGYIVVAPDHKDAMCKVDQPARVNLLELADRPTNQKSYSDASYKDRDVDLESALDDILRDPDFRPRVDANRIAGAGHSLGGYTILGMAGAWPRWKDPRIKAVLLLSPVVRPFLDNGGLRQIHIPVMFQGGTRDFAITPQVDKSGGAYDMSNPPKYFVEFKDAGHLDWSNWACGLRKYVPDCANLDKPRLINTYALAFLNRYIKGVPQPVLERPNSELADLRYAE